MTNQNTIPAATSTSQLEAVVNQFEHWRATRSKRGRIPDALWALVAPLMEQYSRNEIASALRLNHAQMKERISQVSNKSTTFVEYPMPAPTSSMESCVVELTCRNGSTVKISGLTAVQLQPLISVFVGAY